MNWCVYVYVLNHTITQELNIFELLKVVMNFRHSLPTIEPPVGENLEIQNLVFQDENKRTLKRHKKDVPFKVVWAKFRKPCY